MLKRQATKLAGWGFVCLGIIGLFLPLLQGLVFLLIGLFILSLQYVWAQRILDKLKARFPKLARRAAEASASATVWFESIFPKRSERE